MRRATLCFSVSAIHAIFLSTLSLRRATRPPGNSCGTIYLHFYPRSPCGERLPRFHADAVNAVFLSTLSLRRATHGLNAQNLGNIISIHALLAESDAWGRDGIPVYAISIHALLAESDPCSERQQVLPRRISIHALLAESDYGRLKAETAKNISIHALLAESDADKEARKRLEAIFLSTLSLRRATLEIFLYYQDNKISIHALLAESDVLQRYPPPRRDISIHALLAESDARSCLSLSAFLHFYPRSPCGERPGNIADHITVDVFLSTLSLRRATVRKGVYYEICKRFLSTLSLRRATARAHALFHQVVFLSTLSLRRATSGKDV